MEALWKSTAECFDSIAGTTKRKEITKRLAEYFVSLRGREEDLLCGVYLSIARVSEEANGEEMNTGESILLKALSLFSHRPLEDVKRSMKETGDLSTAVQHRARARLSFVKPKPLRLGEVFSVLKEIPYTTGKQSSQKKIDKILHLLSRCESDAEIKYIVRVLDGRLKIGLSTQTVLCSLALAFVPRGKEEKEGKEGKETGEGEENKNTEKGDVKDVKKGGGSAGSAGCEEGSAEEVEWSEEELHAMEQVKEAYGELPSFSKLIETLQKEGLKGLSSSMVTPGHPLRLMLAMPEKGPASVLERFKDTPFLAEWKYDGERVQVHRADGKVSLFSRGLESTTERFAQIVGAVERACAFAGDFILDGEIVAYDRHARKILPFQVLSNRKRKHTETNTDKKESDIALFVFDLLYLNTSLTKLSLPERKKALKEAVQEQPGEVFLALGEEYSAPDTDRLMAQFARALSDGCEGLMIKSTADSSTYEPSKRSTKWIKLKSDYIEGMHDTFDLIVIGAYTGKGKRAGVSGGFLLGCLNEYQEIESVTKLGTGFTEEVLASLTSTMKQYVTEVPAVQTAPADTPDVWYRPHAVWEIASAGISLSTKYTAGLKSSALPEEKGLSLRFPRFLRAREDKTPDTATTSAQMVSFFFQSQER